MTYILLDAEWNGDAEDTLHVASVSEYPKGIVQSFRTIESLRDYLKRTNPDRIFIHAGMTADVPVLNKIAGYQLLDPSKVIDTFVVSRTVDYQRFNTHSLKEIGKSLGVYKGDYDGGWECYSEEMREYCEQDVEVLRAIVNMLWPYLTDKKWSEALRLEMDTAYSCRDMQTNGFLFDKELAESILSDVLADMKELEDSFSTSFPPKLVEEKRIQYRTKQDGSLYKNVQEAILEYPKTEVDKDTKELVCYQYKSFKPGSPKDRIEVLWDAGWKPFDKTKTHISASRERPQDPERMKHFEYYGWRCNEDNLRTLPESAPQGAKDLAKWLTLEGRRSTLVELLGCVSEDGRIHGSFWHIGAWTHRMSHSNPNQANIPAVFTDTPSSPVEEIKYKYNGRIRECFKVPEGAYLVGTDADSIQLRILAHHLKSEEYREAILKGDKSLGTDIHNVNRKNLELPSVTRDDSKTFIYAWLLGAGVQKVASILKCTTSLASAAIKKFINNTEGLAKLKRTQIPFDAKRGYFIGLDGRKVKCKSEHLMLAGYLQNGEAIIMKRARRLWQQWAKEEGLTFKLVDFVHDEWQTEVHGTREDAERMGELQCKALRQVGNDLGLFCPLEGTSTIGLNWKQTH